MLATVFKTWKQKFERGLYYTETIPLICRANQWTDLYMVGLLSWKS